MHNLTSKCFNVSVLGRFGAPTSSHAVGRRDGTWEQLGFSTTNKNIRWENKPEIDQLSVFVYDLRIYLNVLNDQ